MSLSSAVLRVHVTASRNSVDHRLDAPSPLRDRGRGLAGRSVSIAC